MTVSHTLFLESFHDLLSSQASLNSKESMKSWRFWRK